MALAINPLPELVPIWCDVIRENRALPAFFYERLQMLKAFFPLPCGRVPIKPKRAKLRLSLGGKRITVALSYGPTSERIAICCFVVMRHMAVLVFFYKRLQMLKALFPSRPMRSPVKPKFVQLQATRLG